MSDQSSETTDHESFPKIILPLFRMRNGQVTSRPVGKRKGADEGAGCDGPEVHGSPDHACVGCSMVADQVSLK
jgi:hypothetical protein